MPLAVRQLVLAWAIMAAVGLVGVRSASAQPSVATLFRIFLSPPQEVDSIVSYGEYTRLGDQVVFSLPIGDLAHSPRLHLVSIPAAVVDWPATERYAESARYVNYVATRAETDFNTMSSEVAEALNRIALTENPDMRLRIAEDARRTLVAWPQRHFGYRSSDIRGYVGLLDEVVSELRIATGAASFDLSFVPEVQPPTEALAPLPDLADSVQQALVASQLSRTPAERESLLHVVVAAVDGSVGFLDPARARDIRARAVELLAEEQRVGQAYARLTEITLGRVESFAHQADVRGVEGVLRSIDAEDERLGGARPEAIVALHLAVERTLDDTRALRLARDTWELRRKAYQRYERATRESLQRLAEAEPLLDDIKVLAGPDPQELDDLERRLARAARELHDIVAPPDMEAVHGLMTTAFQFADSAVRKRRQAVASGDMRTAWDASSAAAAAVMLRVQAQERLARLLEVPRLR